MNATCYSHAACCEDHLSVGAFTPFTMAATTLSSAPLRTTQWHTTGQHLCDDVAPDPRSPHNWNPHVVTVAKTPSVKLLQSLLLLSLPMCRHSKPRVKRGPVSGAPELPQAHIPRD